jgi:hypothetical protein
MLAAQNGHGVIVDALLAAGASVDLKRNDVRRVCSVVQYCSELPCVEWSGVEM